MCPYEEVGENTGRFALAPLPLSFAAQVAHPPPDRPPARANTQIADATVFLERAPRRDTPDPDRFSVGLEQQSITRPTPMKRRTSRGTVIWPLLESFAC